MRRSCQPRPGPTGVPVAYTLVVFLAQVLYGYFIEARRARDTAKTFGQYVPREIVEEMAASNLQISMEGKSKEMTVLFSDVRSFTTISEQFKDRPTELSELMNNFLSPLTLIIQQHRGEIEATSPGPNQGSVFTVRLPLYTPEPAVAELRRAA